MTKDVFRQWFLNEIQGRWARCEFTAVQLGDWYWRLKGFDAATLAEAAQRHHVQDEPRRPSLKAIHDYAKQWRAKHAHTSMASNNGKQKRSGVPEAHTYIQCIGKDEHGNGPVGWFVPVLLWPFHQEYTQAVYDKTAAQQLQMHQHSAGGVWEVVTGTTHSDMRIRQWQLTGQWERIQQNVGRIDPAAKRFQKI